MDAESYVKQVEEEKEACEDQVKKEEKKEEFLKQLERERKEGISVKYRYYTKGERLYGLNIKAKIIGAIIVLFGNRAIISILFNYGYNKASGKYESIIKELGRKKTNNFQSLLLNMK